MKIDDAIIDKVLNKEASVEEAGLVAEWFATEEGSEYLSGRLESESARLTEERALGMVRPSGAGRTDAGTLHRANKT